MICADPQLGMLDRQIAEAYERVLKSMSRRSAADLRKSQHDFLATRNASFRRPGYDLKKVMQERLRAAECDGTELRHLVLFSLNRGPFPGKYPSNKAGT